MVLTQLVVYVKRAVLEDPFSVVEAETPAFIPSDNDGFGIA